MEKNGSRTQPEAEIKNDAAYRANKRPYVFHERPYVLKHKAFCLEGNVLCLLIIRIAFIFRALCFISVCLSIFQFHTPLQRVLQSIIRKRIEWIEKVKCMNDVENVKILSSQEISRLERMRKQYKCMIHRMTALGRRIMKNPGSHNALSSFFCTFAENIRTKNQ